MLFTALFIITMSVLIDQYTKFIAKKRLNDRVHERGFLSFSLVKNEGAFRGLLHKNKKLLKIIQTASIGIVGLMLLYYAHRKDKGMTLGLSLVLGGAIGNWIDRMRDGHVTDFFAVRWTKNLYYNIADLLVFLGAIITCIRSFMTK